MDLSPQTLTPRRLRGIVSACGSEYAPGGAARNPAATEDTCLPLHPVAQTAKNPPAMRQMRVQSLGQEGPLEEETATHSSILAWRIPWAEEPGGLVEPGGLRTVHRVAESDMTEQLTLTPNSSQSSNKIATEMTESLDPNNNTITNSQEVAKVDTDLKCVC